jgi:hypothetical protein
MCISYLEHPCSLAHLRLLSRPTRFVCKQSIVPVSWNVARSSHLLSFVLITQALIAELPTWGQRQYDSSVCNPTHGRPDKCLVIPRTIELGIRRDITAFPSTHPASAPDLRETQLPKASLPMFRKLSQLQSEYVYAYTESPQQPRRVVRQAGRGVRFRII